MFRGLQVLLLVSVTIWLSCADVSVAYPGSSYEKILREKRSADPGILSILSNVAKTVTSGGKSAVQKGVYTTLRLATHNAGYTAATTFGVAQLGGIAGGLIGDFLASKVIYNGKAKQQYKYIQDLSNPVSLLEFGYGAYVDSYPLSGVSKVFVRKTAKKEAKKAAKKAMKKIASKIMEKGEDKIKTVLNTIIKLALIKAKPKLAAAKVAVKVFGINVSVPTTSEIRSALVKKIIGALKKMKNM